MSELDADIDADVLYATASYYQEYGQRWDSHVYGVLFGFDEGSPIPRRWQGIPPHQWGSQQTGEVSEGVVPRGR